MSVRINESIGKAFFGQQAALSAHASIYYLWRYYDGPIVIVTPLGPKLKLSPACVDVIWITTPREFFIATALAPPAIATPAETAAYTPPRSEGFVR
jgi:hypothetical protein